MNPTSSKLPVAVLISGGGRTLVNIAEHIEQHDLPARIVQVIASRTNIAGIQRAQELNLPIEVMSRREQPDTAAYSRMIFENVRASGAKLVVLAGWLNLLAIPEDFEHRVINTHPALLPSFGGPGLYGHHVHQAVLDAGCKVSGCTVHFADATYDTGPIIIQRCCPVVEGDTAETLAARVFAQECIAVPEAVRLLAEDRVEVIGRVTRIKG